jgi:hypothetical protein
MANGTRIQIRRGTTSEFLAAQTAAGSTPILLLGEIAFETNTLRFKVGNGTSLYGALAYTEVANADYAASADNASTADSAVTALTAGKAAKITASGLDRTIFVASTAPTTGMVAGDIWINSAGT